ncbi:hypothetical protein ES703_47184 [subsurface metagenome]
MLVWIQGIMKSPANPVCPECGRHIAGRHINGGEPCYLLLNFTPKIEHETDEAKSELPSVEVVKILCHICYRQGKDN